jgi:SAM-dependent methyltransferase
LENYLEVNKKNWDSRVPIHLKGYRIQEFLENPEYISDVVRFDLPRLPEIRGLEGIHLQCHIGTDTLSLARLGAIMTALDFSEPALEAAEHLAKRLGVQLATVLSDVYSAKDKLSKNFDFVYTGIGALCWLPEIKPWASVVSGLLKPGGFLFIREEHPMLGSIGDGTSSGELTIEYDYFEGQGSVASEEATYGGEGKLTHPESVSFNHGLAEVFNALWEAGLVIELFEEHRSVPWNPLGDEFKKLDGIDEWELVDSPNRLAASYTILARKPA